MPRLRFRSREVDTAGCLRAVSAPQDPAGPAELSAGTPILRASCACAATRSHRRAGGIDNGAPGLREHYHPTYYGAFVLDPDGNNVEAVSHGAE